MFTIKYERPSQIKLFFSHESDLLDLALIFRDRVCEPFRMLESLSVSYYQF